MNKDKIIVISTYILQIAILIASLLLRLTPLTIFLLLILFLRIYLHYQPQSKLKPILGKWIGPLPKENELLSSFQIRTGLFSLIVGISLGLLAYCGLVLLQRYQIIDTHVVYIAICAFVLPILSLVFVIDGLGKIGKGLFRKFIGHEKQFNNINKTK
jgi:hypothetical protein